VLVLMWRPPCAPSQIRSPNFWYSETAVMYSILMLWSKSSEHYLITWRTEHAAWQYLIVRRRFSSLRALTTHIYEMNNCMQWSPVFTIVVWFQLRVWKVNTYLKCVDVQKETAGAEGTDRMAAWGLSETGHMLYCTEWESSLSTARTMEN
jgi:hypothetical protein